jgi:hypothetical protein
MMLFFYFKYAFYKIDLHLQLMFESKGDQDVIISFLVNTKKQLNKGRL